MVVNRKLGREGKSYCPIREGKGCCSIRKGKGQKRVRKVDGPTRRRWGEWPIRRKQNEGNERGRSSQTLQTYFQTRRPEPWPDCRQGFRLVFRRILQLSSTSHRPKHPHVILASILSQNRCVFVVISWRTPVRMLWNPSLRSIIFETTPFDYHHQSMPLKPRNKP